MSIKPLFHKPSARQLGKYFQKKSGCLPPPENKVYTNDTPSLVNAIPEFAPMGGVLIAYPGTIAPATNQEQFPPSGPRAFGIPNELIIRMQQNDSKEPVHIFVMCLDPDQKEVIDKDLQATAGKLNLKYNPDHLHIVPWDTDTYWTRDFGPWWIYNKTTGYYGIAKHTYTTLGGGSAGLVEGAENVDPMEGQGIFRPNDDYGAVKFSDYLNGTIRAWNNAQWILNPKEKDNLKKKYQKLPEIKTHDWYFLGLLDVGGDYMVDGKGSIGSSYLVAVQNELPAKKEALNTEQCKENFDKRMTYILEQMNRFMGIKKYHVSTDPTGTYIGHIDCWGKFLSEDTILIAKSEREEINKCFDSIAESYAKEGYKVARVLCQDMYIANTDPSVASTTAAYTNSLILNDHLYFPMAGKGYEKYDEAAKKVYQEAMPNHKVVGIIGKKDFPWLGTDAMHCRTRGVPREVVNNWLAAQQPGNPEKKS